jgi:1-pyrroline-5-carboxylate dehydrogenase
MLEPFRNQSYIDFSIEANRQAQDRALEEVRRQFDRVYPLWIGGKEVESGDFLKSYDPSDKQQVVGTFHRASRQHVDQAIAAAEKAFEEWRWVDPKERAIVLLRAAEILKRRRFEINAWMIYEVGKNWLEADADTAEAIDFLEFYAREMLRYSERQPVTPVKGECPELVYIPLGVGAVIPPWNFPMAILTGMTSAAIVTGNTVVLKPASDSPAVGYRLVEIFREAGLPDGVLNYLPGSGGEIGDYLVQHPRIRFVAFTGSKEVGLRINELAAKPSPGQIWIKRTILEMGGKDTIIVDPSADLDAALQGVINSAFGFQGQKCSACSRLILFEDIYEEFLERLIAATEKITIGPVRDPKNWLGPVINQASEAKILHYIAIGKNEGKLVTGGEKAPGNGYFIKPTIFRDVQPGARIEQEEIFGPVLSVLKVRTFEEAIRLANATEYGLTGSLYSRDRRHIQEAKLKFHVGNLYINRKCTGALVGVHPFGGFNMSGTDSKAGGRDYLLLFLQAKSVSEKVDY